jgi:hypothetical protein
MKFQFRPVGPENTISCSNRSRGAGRTSVSSVTPVVPGLRRASPGRAVEQAPRPVSLRRGKSAMLRNVSIASLRHPEAGPACAAGEKRKKVLEREVAGCGLGSWRARTRHGPALQYRRLAFERPCARGGGDHGLHVERDRFARNDGRSRRCGNSRKRRSRHRRGVRWRWFRRRQRQRQRRCSRNGGRRSRGRRSNR